MKRRDLLKTALAAACAPLSAETTRLPNLLLCGGNVVYDAELHRDGAAFRWGAIRAWVPERSAGLPLSYCLTPFDHTDDCKPIDEGRSVLVTASTGGVAIYSRATLATSFYAKVPNAHSACILPGDHIAVASSTPDDGNAIVLFHRSRSEAVLFKTPLTAAHGLEWDDRRRILYAIGYDVLREYRFNPSEPSLTQQREYKLPGPTGHELTPGTTDDQLLLTIDDQVLIFDRNTGAFSPFEPISKLVGVKCVSLDRRTNLAVYIQCEDIKGRWWSFLVRFAGTAATLESPGQRLYKVRWAA